MEFKLITSSKDLDKFCSASSNADWLALDTEFIREKTFYPNLCLIQIASEHDLVCIDTLAINDLSSLKKLLYQTSITKIFHSASQDLEIFVNLFDVVPTPMFDTQIAASLLGYGEQVSYAQLVNEICSIELDKSLSRTNWERRPLSNKELKYAIDDVKYLAEIYQFLKTELGENGRSHWADFECNNLASIGKYKINTDKVWKTIKGAGKLTSNQLNILKQLAKWREEQAMTENKPRRWVLSDKVLRILAIEQPTDISSFTALENISEEHFIYAESLILEIKAALKIPEHDWPAVSTIGPLNSAQRKLVKVAQSFVRERAEELNISPSLLATRSVVEKLIRGKRELDILSSWKKDLIGDELVALIEANDIT